jgi:hypothetical protein
MKERGFGNIVIRIGLVFYQHKKLNHGHHGYFDLLRRRKKKMESDYRGQCYKTFYGRKLRLFLIGGVLVPGKPFQPSLMFADKAGAYLTEAPFR